MKNLRAARRYAVALMEVADSVTAADALAADLNSIGATLRGSRELQLLLASPVVRGPRKRAVFDALFSMRLGATAMGVVRLLIAKSREPLLPDIIDQFLALRDERQNVVTVGVTSAVELPEGQQKSLTATLEKTTGKSVRLRLAQDNAVRGGLIVKIGDTVLDGSVRRQLELLHDRFAAGSPSE